MKAVITGAVGGIGTPLCHAVVAQGYDVVLVDRDAAKARVLAQALEARRPGCVAGMHTVDLSDHADIRRTSAEIVRTHPELTYLFNNAGVLTETLRFSKSGNELHFEVNALAPLALIDALRPSLVAGGGTVINTTAGISLGVAALDFDELIRPKTFSKLFGPYTRSKQALNVLTAALGRALSSDGIRVRAVDPGPVRTALTKGAGTPLWMRVFAPLLSGPDHGAKKIAAGAFDPTLRNRTGVVVSGKVKPLPPGLTDEAWQDGFLAACRERAAMP